MTHDFRRRTYNEETMRPGKSPSPNHELDLEKLWRALEEEPPGRILMLSSKSGAEKVKPSRSRIQPLRH
jgi:hypothetical protein